MDSSMFDTICSVSDVAAAASQLGGKLEVEKCGFLSKCTHAVEKYDITKNETDSYVEIMYCELDWVKAAPMAIVCLFVLVMVYRRMPSLDWKKKDEGDLGKVSSSKYSKYGR